MKRKDSLHQPKSTMEMNRKMDRITLLEQTLDHKLEKYEAEEFDETYVEKKVGLKRLEEVERVQDCLLYTSPSPRDLSTSRMPSSA